MSTLPPPVPDDIVARRTATLKKTIQWGALGLLVLFVIGSFTGKNDTQSTPSTVAVTSPPVTQPPTRAEIEQDYGQWVIRQYDGVYSAAEAIDLANMACAELAAGKTKADLIEAIATSDITEQQMLDIAGIMGEGIRRLCPQLSWKLDA